MMDFEILENKEPKHVPQPFNRWIKKLFGIRHGVAYIFLDNFLGNEEFEGEVSVHSLIHDDFLDWELSNAGLPEEDEEFCRKFKSGYYRAEFEHYNDQEFLDGWPIGSEYTVFAGFINLTPAPFKGRILSFLRVRN